MPSMKPATSLDRSDASTHKQSRSKRLGALAPSKQDDSLGQCLSPRQSASCTRGIKLPLHALIEASDIDDNALVHAIADRLFLVVRLYPE